VQIAYVAKLAIYVVIFSLSLQQKVIHLTARTVHYFMFYLCKMYENQLIFNCYCIDNIASCFVLTQDVDKHAFTMIHDSMT